ncbi:TMV resistance protein N-like [Durio zibethinus]|uniref:TMV resistance protein N-like n=1 Tax=Durio zibethinus TaxID=66656 RepID=A0A6P5X2C2_DURZI|nr:TMV resistance protein N-like [Durio zibethinus]
MAAKGFSEASSSGFKWNHDVFLSFRGEDTRKNFSDHLYAALVRHGVVTFRDDDELPRGKDISSELLKAIEESKLSIVVFSKNYASSRWCLDELVKIIECKNTTGQVVIPVFYDIDPSDVRKQIGSYEEAFAKHKERFKDKMERIKKWRKALTEAGNLSGWDLRNMANGYESKFIQEIVDDVIRKLNRNIRNGLHVATHPVALESRIKRVMRLLDIRSEEVRVVGIYGMSGIGKTTIAKAVYNLMVCEGFEGCSFLSNIEDDSQQPNGLARMQEKLLSDILNGKKFEIDYIDRGVNLIKERLCCRRVFIVLDDLVVSAQWRPLVGDRKWFGRGSRILVTTRDEHLLTELEVDERYKVQQLNHKDSIQFLSWYAFRRPASDKDFFELSNSLVEHVEGLPLALEIFGSSLFKRSLPEWESFLEKLQKVPHQKIQKKLRISFDTLDDDLLKAIFLDIACFYIGMDKDYVMTILDGCGFFPEIGMKVLLERSLIAINPFNKLEMHNLLRDMGREIVHEVSPSHPGYRSRLWFHQDVVNVLTKHMGTEAVEGLSLGVPALEDDLISTKAFARMINLRLLKIDSVHFTGSCEKISKELRWLCWRRCPLLMVLPPNLYLDNLVVLDMQYSSIKKVWKETKALHKLKILDLSYSYLGKTPNFAKLSSLRRLELEGCTGLVEVDQSIGHLEKLEFLNLAKCKNISELPDSICNLRSLETMNLNGCSKLCSLPEHLGKLEALRKLVLSGSAITELPSSIGLLKNLEDLSLAGLRKELPSKSWFSYFSSWISPKRSVGSSSLLLPATFSQLSSLRELNLGGLNLSDHEISIDFGSFHFLRRLDLRGNNFCNVPAGISNHPWLDRLILNNCKNLRSITELPKNLKELYAEQCTSIERYPNLSNIGRDLNIIAFSNCREVADIQGWDFRSFYKSSFCSPLRPDPNEPEKRLLSKFKYLEANFPAREVPDWFDYKEIGSSILFCMPSIPIGLDRGMIVCAIYSVNEECNDESTSAASLTIYFKNKTKGCETFDVSCGSVDGNICQDHAWVSYMAPSFRDDVKSFIDDVNAEEGDEIEVSIEPHGGILVKKCGIHLRINGQMGLSFKSLY